MQLDAHVGPGPGCSGNSGLQFFLAPILTDVAGKGSEIPVPLSGLEVEGWILLDGGYSVSVWPPWSGYMTVR